MRCANCGEELSFGAAFCPRCGKNVAGASLVVPQPSDKPDRPLVAVLDNQPRNNPASLLVTIGAIVFICFHSPYGVGFAIMFGFLTLWMILHTLVHIVVAKWMGVQVIEADLFAGPAALQWKWRDVVLRVNSIPWPMSCAKFACDQTRATAGKAIDQLSRWRRAALTISAPLTVLLVGIALLGPRGAVEGFRRIWTGFVPCVMHPYSVLSPALQEFFGSMRTATGIIQAGGFLALFLAVLNLLPFPMMSGGQALIALLGINGKWKGWKVVETITLPLMFAVIGAFISFVLALFRTLR